MGSNEIIPSVSIANLVNQRQAVVERVKQAVDLLEEARGIALGANIGFPSMSLDARYSSRGDNTQVVGDFAKRDRTDNKILQIIDSKGWDYLLRESGLMTFMDAATRDKWRSEICDGKVPPLTIDNIKATFGQLYKSRGQMFEDGVIACFRRLSWCYKSNLPQKFGKRIIMNRLLSWGGPDHRAADELDDLMRVMCLLDGKPEPDHRQGMYAQLAERHRKGENTDENDYFLVRWFKKGSGHIYFKRPDLVKKMNLILAKRFPDALPPASRRGSHL